MADFFTTGSLGLTHTLFAVLAMVSGWRVLAMPKGNRLHKMTGYVYVGAMVAMNFTGLFVQSLFRFGPFHWLALISLATVIVGVRAARSIGRKTGALNKHYELMSWSYVGLLAAFVSEVVTRTPWAVNGLSFALSVLMATTTVMLVGKIVIRRSSARRHDPSDYHNNRETSGPNTK